MNKFKCLKVSWESYIIAEPGGPPCSACVLWSVLLTAQVWVYYSSYLKGEENFLHVFPKMCDHSKPLQINPYEASHMKGLITKKSCMNFSITVHLFWSFFSYFWLHRNGRVAILIVGLSALFFWRRRERKELGTWNLNLSSAWTSELTREVSNLDSVFCHRLFRSLYKFKIRTWAYGSVSTLWELQPEAWSHKVRKSNSGLFHVSRMSLWLLQEPKDWEILLACLWGVRLS